MNALEQAIFDNPDDVDAYLVYADAIGGTHGELVVLQHQQSTSEVAVAREHELRSAIEKELGFGVLSWRMGFIHKAVIRVSEPDDFRAILDHPAMRFVTDLSLEVMWGDGDTLIPILGEHQRALRELSLYEETGDPSVGCVEATSALWAQLPYLESVVLESERPMFHEMRHARVRELSLKIAPFEGGFYWELPSLVSIEWDPHIESECDIGCVDSLWEQKLPALRDLRLDGILFNASDIPLFLHPNVVPFVKGLRTLSLPIRAVTNREEVVAHLLAHAKDLEHLDRLELTNVRFYDALGDTTELFQRLPNLKLE